MVLPSAEGVYCTLLGLLFLVATGISVARVGKMVENACAAISTHSTSATKQIDLFFMGNFLSLCHTLKKHVKAKSYGIARDHEINDAFV